MERLHVKLIASGLVFMLLICSFSLWAQTSTRSQSQWIAMAKKGEKKLAGADFTGADLENMDLSKVDLTGANLTGVNLTGANLTEANLYHSKLTGANFTGANLAKTNFLATDMRYVNFKNANLKQALLQEANLEYAVLNGAILVSANLVLANLEFSDLQSANLSNAVLVYNFDNTANSETIYSGNSETLGYQPTASQLTPAPDIVETEGLGKAIDQAGQNKTSVVKLKGTKINTYTKGIDLTWAKQCGAVMMPTQIKKTTP